MLITPLLYVPRFIVWNKEEAQKSHLFGDLKYIRIDIAFGRRICQNLVHISRNQQHISTGGQIDSAWQKAPRVRRQYGGGNAALAAFPGSYHGSTHRDLTRDSMHSPWCPLLPINTLGFPELSGEEF